MTNKEVLKKLKFVQEIKPEARWAKNCRADLLFKIKDSCHDAKQNECARLFVWLKLNFGFLLNLIFPERFVENFARPFAVSFVGAMIVIGSMATVGISRNTAPGSILYPVKIVGENIQLSLASNIEDKARLEMEFAGRRIEELNKLVAANKLSSVNLEEKMNKVTIKLRNNIHTANVHLAELDNSGEADKALKVAKEIDKKVLEYTVALNKINKTATVKSSMAEALSQVEEVSDKALEVIVAKHKDAQDGISDSEIAEKLNNKIASAIIEIDGGKDSKIENQALDQTFQDARDLIQTGDFAAALNKITEGKDIIKELRAKMDETMKHENNVEVEEDEDEAKNAEIGEVKKE